MTNVTRNLVLLAVLLGILGDRLLANGPGGPGWLIWIALFGASAVVLVWRGGLEWTRETIISACLATAATALPVFRATEVFIPLSMLLLVTAASLPVLRARGFSFGRTPVLVQFLGIATTVLHAIAGTVALIGQDMDWKALPERKSRIPRAAVIARGLLLAIPPVALFATLFVAADATFEHYVRTIFGEGLREILSHLAIAGVFGWITAGLMRGLLPRSASPLQRIPGTSLPGAEVVIALSCVTAVFAAFVLVQAENMGMSLSYYARRGFFELVTASALALPMLLVANAAVSEATNRIKVATRLVSFTLVVLVFVVMGSALQRMTAYTQQFGLTEARLYPTVFMAWLAAVFGWFLGTTLRGRPRQFSAGMVAAGILTVFTLAAINPDHMIARVNIGRAERGAELDAKYLTRLSEDAAPVLFANWQRLPVTERCVYVRKITQTTDRDGDWRTYNVARAHAKELAQPYARQCPKA